MGQQDRAYKQLFQHKILLQQLFTPEMLGSRWTGLLDFEHAELLSNELISARLALRQSDQIWRIKRLDSADNVYLLLMLEFQSSVEPSMALRLSTYVTLMYEQLLRQQRIRLCEGLPAVLPLVLYTGTAPWTAARELSALIQPVSTRFATYQPQQRYLLIEQGIWAKNKALPHTNLTALLFLLEHCTDTEQAQQLLRAIDRQSSPYATLRRAFLAWFRDAYLARVAPGLSTDPYHSFEEVHEMLELDPRRWGYKERMEGRQEGLQEGLQAQMAILLRQLESKFGRLPAGVQQRLEAASLEQRETWALNLLTAKSLDEVFDL